MNIETLIGTLGAGIVLIAFFLNQTHRLSQDSATYDILNFIGSGLLVAYAILLSSIPFAVLNGIWALVSLRDILFSDFKKRQFKNHRDIVWPDDKPRGKEIW